MVCKFNLMLPTLNNDNNILFIVITTGYYYFYIDIIPILICSDVQIVCINTPHYCFLLLLLIIIILDGIL